MKLHLGVSVAPRFQLAAFRALKPINFFLTKICRLGELKASTKESSIPEPMLNQEFLVAFRALKLVILDKFNGL